MRVILNDTLSDGTRNEKRVIPCTDDYIVNNGANCSGNHDTFCAVCERPTPRKINGPL